ncbi:UNVERIFIED_CONTAM: hypothetical protein B566_EDAN019139, partial [Ephemera danica]
MELQPMLNPSLVVDTLTPPYMLVVFFYASVLPRLGSGPIWNVLVQRESQYCKDNWWTNALYVN